MSEPSKVEEMAKEIAIGQAASELAKECDIALFKARYDGNGHLQPTIIDRYLAKARGIAAISGYSAAVKDHKPDLQRCAEKAAKKLREQNRLKPCSEQESVVTAIILQAFTEK